MKPSLRIAVLLALGLGLLSGGPVAAQPDDPPPSVFTELIQVEVVNVDVWVTDKRGRRIEGLERDDFELLVDGKPVEISNFYVGETRRQAPSGGRPPSAPAAAAPPAGGEPGGPAQVDADQRLLLVIYIDNVNLHPLTRNKLLRRLRLLMLRPFGPDDRFLVVSYDRKLNERLALTDDRRAVLTTLVELEELSGHRQQADQERDALLDEIYDAESPGEVSSQATFHAESEFDSLNRSIDALKEIVDSLAGLPGRKAVIYVSEGLPLRAGADVFAALADRFAQPREELRAVRYDASRRFERLANQANANRTVIYSIDAAGLRTHGAADASLRQGGRATGIDSTRVANLQDPLFILANETGGQVIANTNNYTKLLERVREDFDRYYSLGFVSPASGSGRYHSIEVRVPGRGDLVVRHREGYRVKPSEQRMTETVLAALRYGIGENPLGVKVEFGPGTPRSEGGYLVPLTIRIPMGKLVFFPFQESHRSQLQLFISVRNEEGATSPVERIFHPITIRAELLERALESEYRLEHQLLMRPGKMLVAVGVRDEIGATSSVVLGGYRGSG